jgi:diaminohydroxyphosphoribosylaminopyrimidine deaminase / 5-amino-6-(5-phosphoribosylamino)uracil reductase
MNPPQTTEASFMRECLRLAREGMGTVSPNPMVGAVLVRGNRIVARGYHKAFGGPHAEVECLARYNGSFDGTTLYVSLEPCSHFGKTPPCADLLAATPISRIVVAMADPNPDVSGRGIAKLRGAGKRVDVGVLESEARALNRHYAVGITQHRPYVHVKIAQSLDGMIAARRGKRRWISGVPARELVHRWRAEYDAVLVGAGTVRADNPRLTARIEGARNPAVVILDGRLTASPDAGVFRNSKGRRVLLCCARKAIERKKRNAARLEKAGIELVAMPGGERLRLPDLLSELYVRNVGSILVEGGSEIFGQFLTSRLVDELTVFIAPFVIGEGVPAFSVVKLPVRSAGFNSLSTSMVGNDIMVKWLRPLE